MSGFRYGEYDDGPDPLRAPYDARAALDELGRSVMSGARPSQALRDLLRRGTRGLAGLDGLRERIRERGRRLRSQGRLDGTLSEARRLLDQAVGQERAALFPDPGDEARLRERELDELPSDASAAIRRLAGYQWRSDAARATFDQLRDLLRREVLDSRFLGMKQALENGSPEDLRRVAAMLDALNAMLEADDRGEHTPADFDRFMAEYGDLFPDRPRDLAELVDSLARRSAAAQRVLDSLTPEQRAELDALGRQAMEEAGLSESMERLGRALRARRPDLAWSGGQPMTGDQGLGMGDATTAVAELAELAELEAALGQDYAGAGLDDVDPEAVRRALGQSAVDDVERLRELERQLRDQGYLSGSRTGLELTPKAVRRLGETALREVFPAPSRGRPGGHESTAVGAAGEPTGSSRPWRFGDEQPLDVVRTLANAASRGGGPGGRTRLRPEDFEVAETERRDAAAVCLLVDLSYSMVLRGLWEPAKRTAMALHALATTRFPQDAVRVIGFNDYARELKPGELAGLSLERVQGTNLQHALVLAGRHLDRHPEFEPIVLVITDGEPTAHLERDGTSRFEYPPTRRTTESTLAEVDRMTRRGARLNVFMLADDPRLEEFVSALVGRNGGRTLRPSPDRLGAFVVDEFLSRRRTR
ncbi:vWA domain-containing protein [Actinorugispora endophytica]|uniref:Uncharacterized protein with von Willebrand factor type A (VWA) domain n=1 Tax=Actinorugispora endophytica TaxID=1605990 RepID=A0A4R6V3I3_9ACTN|nr:hypothetical protein [Actinorugispora endophytica]TDQ54831.1 uncharacterized protein with von Willebrand factor type A (vWA) domain [Actinorugispora endophytica]